METGFFHTFATNLFVNDVAIVRLAGEQKTQGRDTIHFTYAFPSLANTWNVNWMGTKGAVGESGDFWVDKQTLTLLRLEAAANSIPPTLPLQAMNVAMQYETLSVQHKTVLLPSSAEITAIELNGTLHRDVISFSQCHVFASESTMGNSAETLANAVERYEAHREALPAGVEIPITLDSEIRGDAARVGDAIAAHLNKTLKISSELTIPRGATVKGRVRELVQLGDPPNTRQVGLEFNEIDWPDHVGTFFADAARVQQIAGLSTLISRGTMRTNNEAVGLVTRSTTENIRPAETPGMARFFLTGSQMIPKGFQITWRTRKTRHL